MSILSRMRSIRSRYSAPAQQFLWTVKGIALFHVFWTHGYVASSAAGPSMLPTFDLLGESVLVNKGYRRGRGVQVGDVVAYDIPIEYNTMAMKRVIGMPGDYVLLNSPESGNDEMIQVPRGHCWTIGDNLPSSRDSRHYGPVPLALIHGKVVASTTTSEFPRFRWIENPLQRPPESNPEI